MIEELFKFVEGQEAIDDIMHVSLSDDEEDQETVATNQSLYSKINLAISGEQSKEFINDLNMEI